MRKHYSNICTQPINHSDSAFQTLPQMKSHFALFWFFIRPYKRRKKLETASQHEVDTTGADAPGVVNRGDVGHAIKGKAELDRTEQKSRSATELESSMVHELPTPLPELDSTNRE
jgi:hypothetical protein